MYETKAAQQIAQRFAQAEPRWFTDNIGLVARAVLHVYRNHSKRDARTLINWIYVYRLLS